MIYLALALIILVAYLVTLKCKPSKIELTILAFHVRVDFAAKDKSGNA